MFEGTMSENLNLGSQEHSNILRILRLLELEKTISAEDLSSSEYISPEKFSTG
jgi:ABC-type transport system involved in cytochrome bd biosynthesis fused ATPase/permease subunit